MRLGHAQMQALSERSGVPFTTLWKVRNGKTKSPRLGAVHAFYPLINEIASVA